MKHQHFSRCCADIFERFAALEKSGAVGEEGAGAERRAGGTLPSREGQRGQDHEDGEIIWKRLASSLLQACKPSHILIQ